MVGSLAGWRNGVCGEANKARPADVTNVVVDAGADVESVTTAQLPLVLVADVDVPGRSTRFDYQDIDPGLGHLVTAHMNDGTVLITDLKDGSLLKEVPNSVARGIAVADDVGITFATSSPNHLVLIDSNSMTEIRRVVTGSGPDGVAWDPQHQTVGVSDQGDGALSLIPNAGSGTRVQVPLGSETRKRKFFDPSRGVFWITVVGPSAPDRLLAVDPTTAKVTVMIKLPGCDGAHGCDYIR